MQATKHCFRTDLFEDSQDSLFFTDREQLAQDIAYGCFIPRTVHECEEPSICNDVTKDIAQRVYELLGGDQSDWNLRSWLQLNGAMHIGRAA